MGERRVQRRGRCCGWRRRIAGQRVSGQLCEQPQRALGRRARLPARYSASSARFILDCRCRRRGRTSRRGGGSSWLAVAGHRGGRYEQRAGRVRMLGRSYPLVLAYKRGGLTGRKSVLEALRELSGEDGQPSLRPFLETIQSGCREQRRLPLGVQPARVLCDCA